MTDTDEMILNILRACRGPAKALTAARIGAQVFGDGGREREVRAGIKRVIEDGGHGEIIANTGGEALGPGPRGYFWATSPDQIEAYYQVLVSRDHEIRHRMEAAWAAKRRLENAREPQPALPLGVAA